MGILQEHFYDVCLDDESVELFAFVKPLKSASEEKTSLRKKKQDSSRDVEIGIWKKDLDQSKERTASLLRWEKIFFKPVKRCNLKGFWNYLREE